MNHSFEQVRELFLQAREQSDGGREAWLDANCSDPGLLKEVRELLAHDIDDPFLEKPVVAPVRKALETTQRFSSSDVLSKTFAGRYKLLQQIGEGGFGLVYMADQMVPVRRRVAIKVLRSSMDSKSVLARFESERQALAIMDHPNIARVFDGGVAEDGTPYFVMELVNGVPITDFCDANQLSNVDRMKLLTHVCNAVQHAHQKGIIHRDLKPSNILVSLLDGVPVPKVIDFGIAKALHGPLTDKTLFTSFQQMIGTLEYMSPEQAEISILDADTRSDVFSLGVIAYELLTGTTPFDGRVLRKLAFNEIQRTIREVEPPKPSYRLSTMGEQAVSIASKHGLSHNTLQQAVRGDLDWIVMKAMEKDRERRYGSAQSMADDIKRWLSDEPIEARPPSMLYLASKFLRKHRIKVAIASTIGAGILISAIGLGYGLLERNASLQRQKDDALRTEQLQKLANLEADRNEGLRYGNAMIAANESIRNGRRATTLELLAECPTNKRGIEWHWLSYIAADRSTALMPASVEHAQSAVTYADDGKKLYSGGEDGTLREWNVATKKETRSWLAVDRPITAVSVASTTTASPNATDENAMLLCGTNAGTVTLWDADSGQLRSQANVGKPITCSAAFVESNLEGRRARFAVGCDNGAVFGWTGSLDDAPISFANTAQPFRGAIQTLEFSQDGTSLLVAGKGGIVLFDAATGEIIRSAGQSWQSYGALYANNLSQIAIYGPPVETIDSSSLSELKAFDVPSTGLWSAAYVPQSRSLFLATQDQCIRSLNLKTTAQATVAYGHSGNITKLVVARSGNSIATTQADGSLRMLDKGNFSCPISVDAFDCEVSHLATISSSNVFALSNRGEVVRWNKEDDHIESVAGPTSQQGFSLAISPDGRVIASNGLNQKLRVWSTPNSPESAAEYDLALGARYIAFHPDGKHIAGPMPKDLSAVADPQLNLSENQKSNLALWNVETGKVDRCFGGLSNWAMQLRFSNDGSMLAAATISDGAVVWKSQTSQAMRFYSKNLPQVDQVAFSQDGKFLFAAYHNGQVLVWNVETQMLERKMVCHGDQITGLLVTQDGNRIVTASSNDPTLRVWDWRTGQKVAEFDSGLSSVSDLKFVDGKTAFLIGGKNGRIQLLRIAAPGHVPTY